MERKLKKGLKKEQDVEAFVNPLVLRVAEDASNFGNSSVFKQVQQCYVT